MDFEGFELSKEKKTIVMKAIEHLLFAVASVQILQNP